MYISVPLLLNACCRTVSNRVAGTFGGVNAAYLSLSNSGKKDDSERLFRCERRVTVLLVNVLMKRLLMLIFSVIVLPHYLMAQQLTEYTRKGDEAMKRPVESTTDIPKAEKEPGEPMRFFVGYTYSIEAPYGLTVGGVVKRLGWYARFKTNMAFDNYTNECRGRDELIDVPDNESFQFTNHKKKTSLAASAGLVVKCTSRLYSSVGLGYGKRELLCEYTTTDKSNSALHNSYWAKNLDHSYKGVTAELDLMVKLGPVYVSVGCNTLNFKYADLNAGFGLFF